MIKHLTILIFLIIAQFVSATTYLTYWVNEVESDSIIQGDEFAWEYDVSQVGGSALVSIYVDVNEDGIIDEDDALIVSFSQSDGGLPDGGPSDSSITPDGIVYSALGVFGFAPAHYIFQIEDEQDQSIVSAPIVMEQKESVTVWASGTLSIEDVTAPDEALAYQMIMAEPDDGDLGFWSGLTDANGNYTIILSDSAMNSLWQIGMINENQIPGYEYNPQEYDGETIFLGENSPYDFHLTPLTTVIYGNVYDEDGIQVDVDDNGYLQNTNTGEGISFPITSGTYTAYALFADGDTTDVSFQMHFDGDNFIPDFLIPNTWSTDYYQFSMSLGDSLRRDIHLHETDSVIHVVVTQDDGIPDDLYRIEASSDSGHTNSITDGNGYSELSIKSDYSYNVRLDEEVNDVSTLPPGYYIEDGNDRSASVGDTVRFNLIPAASTLMGDINVDAEYIDLIDTDDFQVQAYEQNSEIYYTGTYDYESNSYIISIPNGEFDIQLNNWTMDFLPMPAQWQNISASDETIDTLNFDLAYTHAVLTVQLINAPESVFDERRWWNITTDGEYPWVYQTYTEIQPDTTYQFRVCEGDWYVPVPDFGPGYTPLFEDSTITVTAGETEYSLVIEYLTASNIDVNQTIPETFYVKQNYPNPFNPVTNFEFGLPQQSKVLLEVYSVTGEKVATLINGSMNSGLHRVPWNAGQLASGMYIFKLQANQKVETRKMLLIK